MKNKKQKIYINGRFLTQKITGVQRYAIEIVKQLDKLESDYEFIILTPKKGIIQKMKLDNIKMYEIGNLNGYAWEQISLPMYMIFKRAKLLNFCNIAPILYPGYVTIHDIAFKTHSEHLDKKFSLIYRFITRMNIKRYKHIFTVSNFSKGEIIENYKISDNKITVTYNSAEHLKKIKPDNSILERMNLKNKDFCFSLGSKSQHKNHQFIMKCAKKNPNMLFVVSGNDNKIFITTEKENDMKNLVYTGYLNDRELVSLYKNCKAFIFPSLYEGFGIPPLEAMEAGCENIILSNIKVLEEIYGEGAKYIDINNEEYESEHIVEKINIERKNVNLLNRYTWKETADKIIESIYREERK